MEQIVQQYIQVKGLNEQQAQQLIQELQQLDEQQLQQVVENMQQQLQENNPEEQMMQYGGIPVSMDGLYEYPNQPVIVPTEGTGKITMRGINKEVFGVSKFGIKKMLPDKEYEFNDDEILEFPSHYFEKINDKGNMILNHIDIDENFINELKNKGYHVNIIP